ncbi:MAG: site-specific integrase [Clostridia bacterium]|nr:site-specific integrase [Clostridia bacterium]
MQVKKITKIIKFSEVLKNFMRYKKTRVKESTLNQYFIFESILLKSFQDMDITKIKPLQVQIFFDDFLSCHSLRYAKNLYNYFKDFFKFACKYEIVNINPVCNVELIEIKKKDYKEIIEQKEKSEKIYSIEDLNNIFSKISISEEEKFIFYFALSTGLRCGEILSLTWQDIDFKENKISINKNLIKNSKKKFVIDSPKTLLSIREIYLTDEIKDELKEYKIKQDKNKFFLGKSYQKYFDNENKKEIDFIFRTKNGVLITPYKLQNSIRKIKRIEKDFHFHRLRHSFTSHAVNSGIDILYISRALGHSNTNTTANIYTHIKAEKIKEVYQKIKIQ